MSHCAFSPRRSTLTAIVVAALLATVTITPADAAPSGQMTWAVHISLAPTWFDPAETPSLITPFDVYAITGGPYVYNTYPEIDGLFSEQVNEQNPRVRTQILQKIQQILHDRAMFAPVLEPAFLNGVGPKIGNSGLGNVANFPYSAPLEDLTLKAK